MSESGPTFRIVTLNCWALPHPWPFGSLHRKYRIGKLIEALKDSNYDVVTLQEIWSESDFLHMAHSLNDKFPYCHYFHSGFTGSGTCIFTVHPITSTLLHRYSLNGFPHHVHRGDWFGGKIVGMVQLKVKSEKRDFRVNVYTTHLHAEYNRKNDLYLPHRISQCFELAQFVSQCNFFMCPIRHTSLGSDFVLLSGDFNIEPNDLGYHLIVNLSQLSDAWETHQEVCELRINGATSERPDNCFTAPTLLKEMPEGKRIDYIMFRGGRAGLELSYCGLCFDRIEEPRPMNYSDHIGVEAAFLIDSNPPVESMSERLRQIATEKLFLERSLRILEEGEVRVLWDRRLFLAICFILVALLVATFNIDATFPSLSAVIAVARFTATLIIGFSLWHGFIGLSIEMKALKETKFSIRKILKNGLCS